MQPSRLYDEPNPSGNTWLTFDSIIGEAICLPALDVFVQKTIPLFAPSLQLHLGLAHVSSAFGLLRQQYTPAVDSIFQFSNTDEKNIHQACSVDTDLLTGAPNRKTLCLLEDSLDKNST